MRIFRAKVSPGKGRFPKSEKARERRRALLNVGAAFKVAAVNEAGLNRSRGAASKCKSLDPDSQEFKEIAAKYGNSDPQSEQ